MTLPLSKCQLTASIIWPVLSRGISVFLALHCALTKSALLHLLWDSGICPRAGKTAKNPGLAVIGILFAEFESPDTFSLNG
jgi:hypothetical protein